MARRKTEADTCPKGFFRFSNPVQYEHDLKAWERHFTSKGIRTVVIKTSYCFYILCREGKDSHKVGT